MPLHFGGRSLAVTAILTLVVTGASIAPASARTLDDVVVASGPDWSVERAPGAYTVTLHLDAPLPIVSDAPTLVVDGTPIGIARTTDGGRTLTVTTTDARVASASQVEKGWASSPRPKAGEPGDDGPSARSTPPAENDLLPKQVDALEDPAPVADPAEPGPSRVTEVEYDFGDHSVALAGYPGTRGEMVGKLYLSDAPGRRPVVVLQHGRHATCGDASTGEGSLAWPCAADEMVVRSYLGYEGTARALASHGYDVVSVSANAINATDSDLPLDQGAQARGRLVLDTLDMLARLDRGDSVTFSDEPQGEDAVTRSFDEAVERASARADQPAPATAVRAAALAGRFDLSRVGLMGHSRGGEGVVTAAQLNAAAAEPYGIRAVLPLAPTDFARRTVADAVTAVMLPYCDGDVADQQGQKYIDDSRRAFDDDVLRSAVWVMGANHNFFSSVWTPGEYPAGAADDWPESDDTSSCATTDPTRLTAAQQYQVGVSYMTGFFRLVLGGEEQFRPLFDGSQRPATTLTPFADVRIMATQPRNRTRLVADFAGTEESGAAEGSASIEPCYGAGLAVVGTPCTFRSDAQVPHWSESFLAPTVPPLSATLYAWPDAADRLAGTRLRVTLPEDGRDVRQQSRLTVKMAPMDSVVAGTDAAITLVDGSGGSFTVPVSALNPYAVNRMPGGFFLLDKVVLQQVTLPLSMVTGVDLGDLREVQLSPGVGADGDAAGGVILSDLAFDSPDAGTPAVTSRTGVNMAPTRVDEGDEWMTAHVAVWLDHASDVPVSAYVNTVVSPWQPTPAFSGSTRVTFAPGETCLAVPFTVVGDVEPAEEPTARLLTSVTTSSVAVSGAQDFSTILIRDDDTLPGDSTTAVAPFGRQGDVCAELEATRLPGALGVSDTEPRRGDTVRITGTGFRAGEGVTATIGGVPLPAAVADANGSVVIDAPLAADAVLGETQVRVEGAGSARVQRASITVRPATAEPTPTPTPTPSVIPSLSPSASPTVAAAVVRPSLARTGTDAVPALVAGAAGLLLLVAGLSAALRARRRRVGR